MYSFLHPFLIGKQGTDTKFLYRSFSLTHSHLKTENNRSESMEPAEMNTIPNGKGHEAGEETTAIAIKSQSEDAAQ